MNFFGLALGFLGALFIVVSQRTAEPQGDTVLLRSRALWIAGLVLLVAGFFLQGGAFFIP